MFATQAYMFLPCHTTYRFVAQILNLRQPKTLVFSIFFGNHRRFVKEIGIFPNPLGKLFNQRPNAMKDTFLVPTVEAWNEYFSPCACVLGLLRSTVHVRNADASANAGASKCKFFHFLLCVLEVVACPCVCVARVNHLKLLS